MHGFSAGSELETNGSGTHPGCTSGSQGKANGVLGYRRDGGDRPEELLAKDPGWYKFESDTNSIGIKVDTGYGRETIPTAKCVPACSVAARTCGALAAIRQALRLPEAASTATVSGCKSSVREITGNRRATTQSMATASILGLCFGF